MFHPGKRPPGPIAIILETHRRRARSLGKQAKVQAGNPEHDTVSLIDERRRDARQTRPLHVSMRPAQGAGQPATPRHGARSAAFRPEWRWSRAVHARAAAAPLNIARTARILTS
jgi:hypothetical protein